MAFPKSLTLFLSVISCFCSLTNAASSGIRPKISLGVSSGNGLEPVLKWTTTGTTEFFDYEGGVDVNVEGRKSLPYTMWGRIKRVVGEYVLTAKGSIESNDPQTVDVELAAGGPLGSLFVSGTAGNSNTIKKAQIKRNFLALGGELLVKPSYSFGKSSPAQVAVGYTVGGSIINVDTSESKLSVAQKVGANNILTPSITKSGDWSLAYSRILTKDGGKLTATYKPHDAVNVKWEDGPWVANMEAPLEGYTNMGSVNVNFKRSVDF